MSQRKAVVRSYMDGFNEGDHRKILDCLTDDVTWYIAGHTTVRGKEEFDAEIVNDQFEGRPEMVVDRMIEEDDTVAVVGNGKAEHKAHGVFRFAFVTVFTFDGELIGYVESYVTPLGAS